MNKTFFEELYKNIHIPVIVCNDNSRMTVVFANTSTYMFNPSSNTEIVLKGSAEHLPFNEFIRLKDDSEQKAIFETLNATGILNYYATILISDDGAEIPVYLMANTVKFDDRKYIVIYILNSNSSMNENKSNEVLFSILNVAHHSKDIGKAIQSIISISGEYMHVSRVYIFEDLLNDYTRNTYEWCGDGIESEIENLQSLKKSDYNYDAIVHSAGLYVAGDIATLPEMDREILEPQGIKAIAIIPLYNVDIPIGYIGYDDCAGTREWNIAELQFLRNTADIISSLIIRRNSETQTLLAKETLQTVSDNTDSVIYVNDFKTYTLKFVNRTLADLLGVTPDELVGKKCWKVLQNMDEPCPFCPMPKLVDENGNPNDAVYEWEHQNLVVDRYFWVKDSIINWTDGNPVHFEVAVDITLRKKYEEQLKHFASIDKMTSTFNREWGYKLIQKAKEEANIGIPHSLCFIDLDGLKKVNDTLGHDAGDTMIFGIIEKIRRRIRKDDMICRWGGDEFIILLRCSKENAESIIISIQNELTEINKNQSPSSPTLMFSYGIVDMNQYEKADEVITAADALMYENKSAKRGETR